jgi:hypothetical protein
VWTRPRFGSDAGVCPTGSHTRNASPTFFGVEKEPTFSGSLARLHPSFRSYWSRPAVTDTRVGARCRCASFAWAWLTERRVRLRAGERARGRAAYPPRPAREAHVSARFSAHFLVRRHVREGGRLREQPTSASRLQAWVVPHEPGAPLRSCRRPCRACESHHRPFGGSSMSSARWCGAWCRASKRALLAGGLPVLGCSRREPRIRPCASLGRCRRRERGRCYHRAQRDVHGDLTRQRKSPDRQTFFACNAPVKSGCRAAENCPAAAPCG